MAGEGRKAVRMHDSMERHAWLVEALDLPRCAAGWGYRYLAAYPDGFDGGPLTAVGADPQEEP